LCGGSIDLIHASRVNQDQIRLNRLQAAIQVVSRDEKLAFEQRNHLIDAGADLSAIDTATARWREYSELLLELQCLLNDEADLQALLDEILQHSCSSPDFSPDFSPDLLKSA